MQFPMKNKWSLYTVWNQRNAFLGPGQPSLFVVGRRTDIERAIELIAKRFPPSRYPQVAFKPINKKIILRQRPPECVPIPPSVAQVDIIAGIEGFHPRHVSAFSSIFPMVFPRKFWSPVWFRAIISSFSKYYIHRTVNWHVWTIPCRCSITTQKRHHCCLDPFNVRSLTKDPEERQCGCRLFSRCDLCRANPSRLVPSLDYDLQQ